MSQTYFSFKQFTIHHDKCAMKVGTDGVLLGAWVDVTSSKRILDIGAGTGLISLMLAQRSDAHIVGVEINQAASEQAKENVLKSPWSHRIDIVLSDINQYKPLQKFDTIVSNPP
jgi:tRNA1Val (adenine37-N6)-methyltransferase